ncbi:MAG: hypothetical protein WA829_08420, partial [Candidatus Acidiferrum sp.]
SPCAKEPPGQPKLLTNASIEMGLLPRREARQTSMEMSPQGNRNGLQLAVNTGVVILAASNVAVRQRQSNGVN